MLALCFETRLSEHALYKKILLNQHDVYIGEKFSFCKLKPSHVFSNEMRCIHDEAQFP